MITRHRPLLAAVVTLATAGVAALGCGSGEITMSEGEVERQAKTALGELVGRPPESIDCPNDMPAKVGQTMRCELRDSGTRYGVTVTITSVDTTARSAKFDVVVDKTPIAK